MALNPLIKMEAMNNMTPPTTLKRYCKFVGLLNYNRGMWERLSHTLEPSTKLKDNKVTFKWTEVEQK